MEDNNLYNITYRHMLCRIQFGYYPTGSRLPSVPDLCSFFQVSRTTVHSALKQLENEGYVSLSQGRSAIVTYSANSRTCAARRRAYCHAAKDAFLDLRQTLLMFWPDLMLQGLRVSSKQDIKELHELADDLSLRTEYSYYAFFHRILQSLGNPLLLCLYQSSVLFCHTAVVPHEMDGRILEYADHLQGVCRKLLSLLHEEQYQAMRDLLVELYQFQTQETQRFYEGLPPPPKPVKPIHFHWQYFTERPQVGFNLAMKLLRVIYSSYDRLQFLPSAAELSKQYATPVITVRRAIRILNDIGVTESINGKGTRVIVGSGTTVDVSSLATPNMKRALLPYIESVQIILIISKSISQTIFPKVPKESLISVSIALRQVLASGDYMNTFGICFEMLIKNSDSPVIKEILGGLMYFQYLGYPLNDMKPNEFRFNPRSTELLLQSVEQGDANMFAQELQSLMMDIYQAGLAKLRAGRVEEIESMGIPVLSLE